MRSLLAVVAGLILGAILVAIVEGTGHALFPLPEGIDPMDPESIRNSMDKIPLGAMLFVLLAWAVGSFGGGWLAAQLTSRTATEFAALRNALIVGAVLMLAGLFNLIAIPSPWWFWVVGLGEFLPAAYVGGVAQRTQRRRGRRGGDGGAEV